MNLEKIFSNVTIIILILLITILVILNITAKDKKNGFTELYFINDLPKIIKINEKYNFSFAIHNLEKKYVNYYYVIYVQSKKIDQGYINLNYNKIAIINQSFIIKNKLENNSIPVSVQLLNKNQEIHFWVNIK